MAITPRTEGRPAAPNTLNPEAEGSAGNPNSLSAETEGGVGNPNPLTPETVLDVGNPNPLTSQTEGSAGNPNSLTAETGLSAGNPNSLTAETELSAGNPNSLSSETALSAGNPNALSATSGAFPRTLIPLVKMDFEDNLYSQNGNPVTFDDLFTYSRNSSASFINRRVVNNQYEYFLDTDYVGSVTNLLTYSEQFDHADWVKANASIIANYGDDLNGGKTADLIYPTTTGTLRSVYQAVTLSTSNHSVSFDVKYSGFKWVKIVGLAGSGGVWFNVSTGTIGASSGSFYGKIDDLGSGWYRCSVIGAGAVSGFAQLMVVDGDASDTATSNGFDGVLTSRAQITLGSKPLPYVKTISTSVTDTFAESLRLSYDPVTGESLGALIEGGSTNLATRSEEFDDAAWTKIGATIDANAIKAPDGTISADKLEAGSTATISVQCYQSVTVSSATSYTSSFFVKPSEATFVQIRYVLGQVNNDPRVNFDLSLGVVGDQDADIDNATIESVGDGWFRITSTVTTLLTSLRTDLILIDSASATSAQGTAWIIGDGLYVFGGMCEELPFASSYIRTESTVTRAADDLSLSQSNEVSDNSNASYHVSVSIDNLPTGGSGATRRIFRSAGATGFSNAQITSSGVIQGFHGTSTVTLGTGADYSNDFTLTSSYSRSNNILTGYINGAEALSGDVGDVFTRSVSSQIGVGYTFGGGDHLFGHIKELSIYNKALTAQEVGLL